MGGFMRRTVDTLVNVALYAQDGPRKREVIAHLTEKLVHRLDEKTVYRVCSYTDKRNKNV